jgi:4-hydroxysphinganine ceramide fatty acyl 2-hydroxylase
MQAGELPKAQYLEFIHSPIHLPFTARLFDWNFFESFSKTFWWVVPLIWVPVSMYFLYFGLLSDVAPGRSINNYVSLRSDNFNILVVILLYLTGLLIWTKLEYVMHRFVFHIDNKLPDLRILKILHFTLHGVHHAIPMDAYPKQLTAN